MAHEWLNEAVFYEIYPQSFNDTNADGIGDLQGIIEKLDYVKELGCNALWLNPCFDSPFVDAGYDVRDFYKIAPRYGTNEDMRRLAQAVHDKGMHIILDLVAGHTSTECEWFKQSSKAEKNEYSDRYIWTRSVFEAPQNVGSIKGWLRGGSDRDGSCALNFFTAQVALNYGFAKKDEGCEWQLDMNDEGPLATRQEIKNIMAYWLGMGIDGFRVDMAGSLVKNDEDGQGTIAVWQDITGYIKKEFPEAVLVSEWGDPERALAGGFDMDFLLHFGPSHYPDLFRTDKPYFSSKGEGDLEIFWTNYLANREKTKDGGGMISLISGNHDMDRMARTLTPDEMRVAFAFLLSMPGVPFIYYGDELGMREVDVPHSVEGGYFRTGARSPMQWDTTTNAGFSSGRKEDLYIRIDEDGYKTINAAYEMADETSLYHEVKNLITLRQTHPALGNRAELNMVEYSDYPLIYERECAEERILVIINPAGRSFKNNVNTDGEMIYACMGKQLKHEGDETIIPGGSAFFIRKI